MRLCDIVLGEWALGEAIDALMAGDCGSDSGVGNPPLKAQVRRILSGLPLREVHGLARDYARKYYRTPAARLARYGVEDFHMFRYWLRDEMGLPVSIGHAD